MWAHPDFAQPANESGDPSKNAVVKISKLALRRCYRPGVDPRQCAAEISYTLNRRYARLRAFFGTCVPWQESTPQNIYFDEPMAAWFGLGQPGLYWAVHTLQGAVPELGQPDAYWSLTLPYAEITGDPVKPRLYQRVNQRWLCDTANRAYPSTPETSEFLAVQQSTSLEDLSDAIIRPGNKTLLTGMMRFVQQAIDYSTCTREILDLAGPNNVILTRDGTCRIIDGLYPQPRPLVDETAQAIQKIGLLQGLRRRNISSLHNGIGYLRSINFLAALCGLEARIEPLASVPVTPETWQRVQGILKNTSLSPRLAMQTLAAS